MGSTAFMNGLPVLGAVAGAVILVVVQVVASCDGVHRRRSESEKKLSNLKCLKVNPFVVREL